MCQMTRVFIEGSISFIVVFTKVPFRTLACLVCVIPRGFTSYTATALLLSYFVLYIFIQQI